jgi:hypothetical protein
MPRTQSAGAPARAKMRALAGTMADPNAAVLLTNLAAHYDNLAEKAVVKADGTKPPSKRQVAVAPLETVYLKRSLLFDAL